MARPCSLCNHPARPEIDTRLTDGETTLQQIIDWLAEEYPNEFIPGKSSLSTHKTEHLAREQARAGLQLQLVEGQLLDANGRPLENVGIAAALKSIVTVGITNILKDPSRVSTKDTIEALRLMKSLGTVSEEMEEMLDMWASTFASPKRKEKLRKGKPAIEGAVVVRDDPPIDPADPWAALADDED